MKLESTHPNVDDLGDDAPETYMRCTDCGKPDLLCECDDSSFVETLTCHWYRGHPPGVIACRCGYKRK